MYFLAIQYSLNVLKVSRCKCYQKALHLFLPRCTSPSAAPWALAFTAVSHLTQTMRLNVQSARANLTPTIAKWKQGRASRALCSSVQRCPCMLFTGAHGEQPLAVPSARAKLLACSPPAATSVVRESRRFLCHKCIKIRSGTSMETPLFASHAHQQGIWGHLFLYVYPKNSSNLFGSRCSVKAAVAAPQATWGGAAVPGGLCQLRVSEGWWAGCPSPHTPPQPLVRSPGCRVSEMTQMWTPEACILPRRLSASRSPGSRSLQHTLETSGSARRTSRTAWRQAPAGTGCRTGNGGSPAHSGAPWLSVDRKRWCTEPLNVHTYRRGESQFMQRAVALLRFQLCKSWFGFSLAR